MSWRWWLQTTDVAVASARLRGLRIISALRAQGLDAGLYQGRDEPRPDILVLLKRYDRRSIAEAQRLRSLGTRLVLDLCDNHFYAERPSAIWLRRAEALRSAISCVDHLTVATEALADVVRQEAPQAPPITVIGDAVEPPDEHGVRWRHALAEWRLRGLVRQVTAQRREGIAQLLWFGHHGSGNAAGGMIDLRRVAALLRDLQSRHPLRLTVISNHRGKFARLVPELPAGSRYLQWHPATFSRAARLHDVALIPVTLNPFTACKSNNRVATALCHGLAVVADPVPSYREFADAIVLGDWDPGLRTLLEDRTLREGMIERGQARVRDRWTLSYIAGAWRQLLTSLSSRGQAA